MKNGIKMKVEVFIEKEKKSRVVEVNEEWTVEKLLKELGLHLDTSIVAIDGTIKVEKEKIGKAKKIEIFTAISGG